MTTLGHCHHDFPRLATQSGFSFRLHSGKVNWTEIENLDLNDITQKRNFQLLERNLINVINCNLEKEYDLKILNQNFVKLFKLAQLGVDYLSYCEAYLDKCVIILQEQLVALQEECKSLKNEKEKRKEDGSQSKRQGKTQSYQCEKCEKAFISDVYLKFHDKRRHSTPNTPKTANPSPKTRLDNSQQTEHQPTTTASTQTASDSSTHSEEPTDNIKTQHSAKIENLEQEIQQLKERLRRAENVLTDKPEPPKPNGFSPFPASVCHNTMLLLLPSQQTQQEANSGYLVPAPEVLQPNCSLIHVPVNTKTAESKPPPNLTQTSEKETQLDAVVKVVENVERRREETSEVLECDKENIDPNCEEIAVKLSKPLPPPRKSKKIPTRLVEESSNMAVEKRESNMAVEKRESNLAVERLESNMVVERRESNMAMGSRDSNMAVERRESNMAVEKRESNMAVGKRESNLAVEKRESNMAVGKRESNMAMGSRDSNMAVERRGSNMAVERRESNMAVEKRESNLAVERRESNMAVERRESNMADLMKSTPLKEVTSNPVFELSESISDIHKRQSTSSESVNSRKNDLGEERPLSLLEGIARKKSRKFRVFRRNLRRSLSSLCESVSSTGREWMGEGVDPAKAGVVEGLNGRLRELGVDPEWSGIPKRTMKEKLKILKQRRKVLTKENPMYPLIRQNIEEKILQKLRKNLTGRKSKLTENLSKESVSAEDTAPALTEECAKPQKCVMYDIESDSDSKSSDSDVRLDGFGEQNSSPKAVGRGSETVERDFDVSVFQVGRGRSNRARERDVPVKVEDFRTDSDSDGDFCGKDLKGLSDGRGDEVAEGEGLSFPRGDRPEGQSILKRQVAVARRTSQGLSPSQQAFSTDGLHGKLQLNAKKKVWFGNSSNDIDGLSDSPTDDWSLKSDWDKDLG